MLIHHSPFERVTAVTDIFMGLLSAYAAIQLAQLSGFKSDIWAWTFGLLAFSSFIAAVAHGFEMTLKTNDRIWMPINLSLGMALGLFVVGALFDLSGAALASKSLPVMLIIGFGFFLVTVWKPGTFMTFIAYEAVAMLFALGVYVYLLFTSILSGVEWMVAGVFVTIFAAVIQATGKADKSIIWRFDNNGVFHLIQMIGILLLMIGLS